LSKEALLEGFFFLLRWAAKRGVSGRQESKGKPRLLPRATTAGSSGDRGRSGVRRRKREHDGSKQFATAIVGLFGSEAAFFFRSLQREKKMMTVKISSTASTSASPPRRFTRNAHFRPCRPADSRPSDRLRAVDTTKASNSVARELAQARDAETGIGVRIASDKVAVDFESWAQRAGIVAPKLRIADFDGTKTI